MFLFYSTPRPHTEIVILLFALSLTNYYISTGMGDRFGVLLVSLMALQLALVDRNQFRPCLNFTSVKVS